MASAAQHFEASSEDVENERNNTPKIFKTYNKRWYILFIFSWIASAQYLTWNIYGPISTSVERAYGWYDYEIALMPNWGTMWFLVAMPIFCWLLERKGLTFVTRSAAFLILLSTILRDVSTDRQTFSAMAHLSSIINGMAGAVVMAVPPHLSAVWFPPEQRTLATCLAQVAPQIGTGISFLVGPLMLPSDNITSDNTTETDLVKSKIQTYFGLEIAFIAIPFLCSFIFFEDKPPTAPSASASKPRTELRDGIANLIKDRNAWFCALAYGISGGTFLAWQSVMTLNFKPLDVSDEKSGQIGSVVCLVSIVLGILVSKLTGTRTLRKHMKKLLVVLCLLAFLFFLWILLLCRKVITFSSWQLWVATLFGSGCMFTLAPLFFEYTVELTYPNPEGLVAGFLTIIYNLIATIFLFMFFAQDSIGTSWMNCFTVVSALVSIPLVYFTTENYRRMEVDAPHSLIREDSFDERHGLLELMDGNNENSDLVSVQSSYGTI